MNLKIEQKIYRANVNAVLMENGGIMINVYVSLKNVIYVKNIIFGILIHLVVKWKIFSQYHR